MYNRVLVANRGEIALRIISTLQDHGIEAIVTASDPDMTGKPARVADGILHLPGESALNTYLDIPLIVDKAKDLGIQAVHPGYGFLAENSEFAKAVIKAKIDFIGPTPDQMIKFGDKIQARNIAIKTDTPLIPGTIEILSHEELLEESKIIGFPLLIKASAGGGGRGIRFVNSFEEMEEQIALAKSEAKLAFNDDRIYIEKFIPHSRHVEVQILGNGDEILHFGERDCTMQRKNQKLIEEAPAPTISRKTVKEIHNSAVELAMGVKYQNAGTVEFLYDQAEKKYYFLEVNARIQVEHPVTEMITGEDLIWRQLQVSAGLDLDISQENIRFKGHAIEARIYAENAYKNFTPSPGRINRISHPIGAGVRVDSAVDDGCEITPFYDPMISKLIVHAHNRDAAIHKLATTLDNYLVTGVHTTIPYISEIVRGDAFKSGDYHTKSLDNVSIEIPDDVELFARAIAAFSLKGKPKTVVNSVSGVSRWKTSFWPRGDEL